MNESSCVFEIIGQAIKSSENRLPVKELCKTAGVSRSGCCAWVKAAPVREAAEEQDQRDFELILEACKVRGCKKGAESIYMNLLHMDPPVVMNLKKIRRLMKKSGLSCPARKANAYRRMAKALKAGNAAENLLRRGSESYGPGMVLPTDITYLPYNGTFAYLSTIPDAFTKQIPACVVSGSLEADFVLETVNILTRGHGIFLNQETILHSGQGCHYTSYRFIEILHNKNLRRSMSRKGSCWDNAPQESFFGHMKDHIRGRLRDAAEFSQVKAAVDNCIDYYNNDRYQWHPAKLSPNEYCQFCITGGYPLKIPVPPAVPAIQKKPEEPGRKQSSTAAAGGTWTETGDNTQGIP